MKPRPAHYAAILAIVAALVALAVGGLEWFVTTTAAGLAMTISAGLVDKSLQQTKALPTGASSVTTTGWDLGTLSDRRGLEILLEVPALATGVLGDAATVKYHIEHDTASDFSTVATFQDSFLVQTGASGAGAAAASKRFALPSTINRHVRIKATKSSSGDASGSSLTATLMIPGNC